MALFKRADLKNKGLTDEQIEFVMTEAGRALGDYELKSSIQAQIDAAVEAARKDTPEPVNVTESAEYQALLAQNQKLTALQTDDFSIVKPPYKDMIWDKLDHGEKHEAYADQLKKLSETMPDLFVQEEKLVTPQFGADTQGTMPQGNATPSFADTWGFVPKK